MKVRGLMPPRASCRRYQFNSDLWLKFGHVYLTLTTEQLPKTARITRVRLRSARTACRTKLPRVARGLEPITITEHRSPPDYAHQASLRIKARANSWGKASVITSMSGGCLVTRPGLLGTPGLVRSSSRIARSSSLNYLPGIICKSVRATFRASAIGACIVAFSGHQ